MTDKHALVIEEDACWGCKTCEVACKQEMGSPEGVQLISVAEDGPWKKDDRMEFAYRVNVCRHCEDPPCVEACFEGAITKREDGIVVMDYDRCTGCKACMDECPYDAIDFDPSRNVVQKCNLCHHRVDKGLIPACADNVCLAHCILFGSAGMRENRRVD